MKHKLPVKKGHLGRLYVVELEPFTITVKENHIDKKVMLLNTPLSFRKRSLFETGPYANSQEEPKNTW